MEICELIFEKYFENPSILLSTKLNDGYNALHRAVANGHLSVCKLLITKLKNKNPKNEFGGSPLDMAATSGHLEICKLIIENIKITNPKGVNKETPLHHAAKRGYLDICKLIIKKTKDKNPKDKMSETPLHHAAKNGHFSICELIITQKQVKEKNPINDSGWTPLRYASKHGFSSICKLIIKAGGRSENLNGIINNTRCFDENGFASNSAKNWTSWTSWTQSKTVPGTFWGGNCPSVPPALIFENENLEDELDNSSPEVNNAIHQLFEVDPIEKNPKWSEVF